MISEVDENMSGSIDFGEFIKVVEKQKERDDNYDDQDDDKVNVIRKAIQCAFDIQKELNNKKIMANVTNLSVKVS